MESAASRRSPRPFTIGVPKRCAIQRAWSGRSASSCGASHCAKAGCQSRRWSASAGLSQSGLGSMDQMKRWYRTRFAVSRSGPCAAMQSARKPTKGCTSSGTTTSKAAALPMSSRRYACRSAASVCHGGRSTAKASTPATRM